MCGKLHLLGVQRPGDHPDDPMSHRPGEPGSVRGEVHAPGLTSGPALQGRGSPGLQLQDESRVGRWRGIERHKSDDRSSADSDDRQRFSGGLTFPPLPGYRPSWWQHDRAAKITKHITYMLLVAPRCFPWSTSSPLDIIWIYVRLPEFVVFVRIRSI